MLNIVVARRLLMCSCAVAVVTPTLALAQATGKPAVTSADDIIVTARKRAESAQDVPVSLTVQSGESLIRQNVVTVADISNATPNVRMMVGGIGGTAIVAMIRGQVQLEPQSTSDPSVGIYVDGAYLARANGSVGELHDIERVEVLKGPQGTLYGRNTPGGAVNIISKAPNLDSFQAIVSARGASHGEMAGRLTLNVPIVSGKAAIRLTGAYTHVDGWARDNQSGRNIAGKDNYFGRAALLLKPTDRLTISTITDYNDIDVTGGWLKLVKYAPVPGRNLAGEAISAESLNAILAGAPLSPAAAGAAGLGGLAANAALPYNQTNLTLNPTGLYDLNSRDETRVWGNATTVSYELNDALLLKSLTSYRNLRVRNNTDVDGTQYAFIENNTILDQHQFSEEVQLQGESAGKTLNWIVGGYYFREKSSDKYTSVQGANLTTAAALQGLFPGITPPTNPAFIPAFIQGIQNRVYANPRRVVGEVVNKSYAAFAQGTYRFSDALSATAGIRYTRDNRSLDSTRRAEISGVCGLAPDVPNVDLARCVASYNDRFSSITWTAGLEYKPMTDMLTYVKASRGFRSGGRNLRGNTAKTLGAFKPETVTDVEVGIKSEFLDRRLRLNFAAFRSDYRDLQRNTLIFEVSQLNSYIQNIQKATITGFEFEAAGRPTRFLELGGTVGYTRAVYNKFLTAEGVDRSAEPFQYVPKWTVSAFAQATLPLSDTVDFVPRIDYRYTDKIFYGTSSATIADDTEPAFHIVNARVSLNVDSAGFEAALFARNLFNKHYYADYVAVLSTAGFISGREGEPRTIGVELRKAF
jgi:iron complex outermembrane recepter protein